MSDTSDLGIERVAASERIASLDVLRGIAILFILFLNIPWMGGYDPLIWDPRYPTWTNADYWTTLVTRTGLEGTQRGLLELLFGAGIMIMARRAMTPDGPVEVADLHYRRNLWLIVFGLANALVLLWFGDILLVYGIAAMFMFPFRKVGPKGQLGFAALLLAGMLFANVVGQREQIAERAKYEQTAKQQAAGQKVSEEDAKALKDFTERMERRAKPPRDNPKAMEEIKKADEAHHGGFVSYWKAQFDMWLMLFNWFWPIQGEIMSTMLVGMALFQWGVIQGKARSGVYWAMLVGGYALGMGLRGSLALEELQFHHGIHWQQPLNDIARLAVSLGHIGLVQLLLCSKPGAMLLKPFVAAGQMPLTVYLFTSLLMMWVIFAPWGFDKFGAWGQYNMVVVAGAIILAELVAANLYMRRFANGPMEWLWKSLAYERKQPFRRVGAA